MKTSLNHAYRLVWNEATGAYVAVAETTRSRGKRASSAVRATAAGLLVALAAQSACALDPGTLPSGANVAAGAATFTQSGNALNVQQGSQKLVINWGSFDIGSAASVNFSQPSTSAIALNRVNSGVPTQIQGALNANGNVWVLNSAGVVFGQTAQVNVGGLVASSLALSDSDFLAGRYRFSNDATAGTVSNAGSINAAGGVVALVAPVVRNSGSIAASNVALVAGDQVTLDFNGDGLLSYTIDRAALGALVENTGHVSGDRVSLSARGAGAAVSTVVNNEGVIEATGLSDNGGRIVLDGGDNGAVHVAGTLDASSAAAKGGSITVTGHTLTLDGGAKLAADGATGGGTVHVGGGYQGQDKSLLNATTVQVDAGVTASARATGSGKGGEVVFWSDDSTRFAGKIDIRGGAQGGDGGRAEVSGKQTLAYSGLTDASAANGATGDLLLDPATITINGGSGTNASDGSVLYANNLQAQTANVYLLASGNVTIADLDLNGGNGKLTMQNNVGLRIDSSTGVIRFTDPTNTIEVSGTGYIYLQVTRSGNLTSIGNLVASGAGVTAASGFFTSGVSDGAGTPGAGSITLLGSEGVTLGGSITTNGGYVRIWADANNGGGGALTLAKPIYTNGGNLYLSTGTGGINMNSDMILGTGRITFKADGTYTSGANILNGLLSASGNISIAQSLQFGTGAGISTDGLLTISSASSMTGSGASLTLTASAFDLQQNITGNNGTVTLKPYAANTSVDIGTAGSGNMLIGTAALSKLSGFSNIIIGRSDGTGVTSVNGATSVAAAGRLELINQTLNVNGGSLTNTTGDVALTGNALSVGNTVSAKGGAGKISLRPLTAGATVDVGGTINNALLNQLQAATLEIGSSTSGDLSFSSDIATTATTVNLLSGGNITATAGGVAAQNLVVSAGGSATISDSTFNFGTLSLTTGAGSTNSVTSSNANWGTTALNLGAGSSTTLQAAGTLNLAGNINFNSGATALTLLADTFSGAPTTTNKTLASVAFDVIDHGNTLTVGAAGSTLSGTTLSGFNGLKNITVGSAGTDVATDAALNVSTAAGGQLKLVGNSLSLGGGVAVTGGSLALDTAGPLTLNHALTAADTVTLKTDNQDIDGSGVISTNHLVIDSGSGNVLLNGTQQVNTLQGTVNGLLMINGKSLTVNGIDAGGLVGLWASGANADLTLAGTVRADSAGQAAGQTSLILIADRNFINNIGSGALDAGTGVWRVYSTSPLNDTRNGLTPDFKQYNAAYGATALGSGNGFLYSVAPTLTGTLTSSFGKTYDGDTSIATGAGAITASGAIDGDLVAMTATGAHYDTQNAGTGKTVTATGVSTSASNGAIAVYGYGVGPVTGTGAITPRTVTLSGSKVYDGTTALTGGVTLGNLVAGETLGYTGATASNAHVATSGKYIDGITLTNGSGLASNYALPTLDASHAAVTITAATITSTATIGGTTHKTYDGAAAASGATVVGTATGVAGDVLMLDASGVTLAYDAATVLGAHRIDATGSLGYTIASSSNGSQASDYVFSAPSVASVAGSIGAKTISAGTINVATKVYDGTTSASLSGGALSGVLGNDQVTATLAGAFDSASAGIGKSVTASLSLSGVDAANYELAALGPVTGTVTPRTVTLSGSKVYDGTTALTGGVTLGNLVAGETLGYTGATASNAHVATSGKYIDGITLTNGSGLASNYVLPTLDASHAAVTITAATITSTATIGGTTHKTYDGTAAASGATVVGTATGVAGDVLTLDASGVTLAYDAATVPGAHRIDATGSLGYTIASSSHGSQASDYVFAAPSIASVAGSIGAKTISAGAVNVATKTFDGTTVAAVSGGALSGVVASDEVTATLAGSYDNASVGVGKTVTVTVALSGRDAANYQLAATQLSTTGEIGEAPATNPIAALLVQPISSNGTQTATTTGSALLPGAAGQAQLIQVGDVATDTRSASPTPAASAEAGAGRPLVQLSTEGEFRTADGISIDTSAFATGAATASNLDVFVVDAATGLSHQGQYQVLDQSSSLSLQRQTGQSGSQPQLDGTVALRTSAALPLQDGGTAQLELSLLSNGVLLVQGAEDLAAMSRDTVSAYALSALKASGIGAGQVSAVVLRFGAPAAR